MMNEDASKRCFVMKPKVRFVLIALCVVAAVIFAVQNQWALMFLASTLAIVEVLLGFRSYKRQQRLDESNLGQS